jgi:predicted enzyme related to lactoylglutathione lyase
MFTPKGKFGWYELMTSDTKAAGKFYADVVGWTTKEVSAGDNSQYTTFNLGDEKIIEAGGKLWKPATDVPGMLRFAVMSDAQGAAIVVFTPHPSMPSPTCPEPPTPGTIGWHELYTTDLEGGFEFYNKLFVGLS